MPCALRRRAAVHAGVAVGCVQRHNGPELLPLRPPAARQGGPLHVRPVLGRRVPRRRPQVRRPRRPLPRAPPAPLPERYRRAAGLPAHGGAQRGLPVHRRRHDQVHRHPPRPAGRRRPHAAVGDRDQPADVLRRPAAGGGGGLVRPRRPRRAHRQRHQALQPLAVALHQGVGAHGEAGAPAQGRQRQQAPAPRPRRQEQEAQVAGGEEGPVRRDRRRDGAADGDRGAREHGGGEQRGDRGPEWRRELHHGRGRRGGRAEEPRRQRRVLPHLRARRRLRGERAGAQAQQVYHDGRRRHRPDRDHRQPERRRRLDHLPIGHLRRGGTRLRGDEHDVPEHSGSGEAPGGGAPVRRRPVGVLRVQLRGVPGHAIHALPPAVLPRLRRLRHRRLRLRQRRRRLPGLHLLLPAPHARAEQHRHGAGPHRPQPEHGHLHPGLQAPPGAGARRQRRLRHAHLPRSAVEELLAHGGHGVVRRRARRSLGLDALVGGLRARHALLRRVQQHRARRRHQPPGVVAGVPRARRRHRRRELHRHQHGARRQLAAADRRALHPRLAFLKHIRMCTKAKFKLYTSCMCVPAITNFS